MCDIGIGDTGKEAYGSTRSYSRSPTSAVNSCCRNVQDWDPRHTIPKSHAGADCVFGCPTSVAARFFALAMPPWRTEREAGW